MQHAGRAVVVGAGQAGGVAVRALREFGWQGPVVLVGAEPHLPYERPPLSKEVLLGEAPPGAGELAPAASYAEAGIELRANLPAVGLDPRAAQLHLADGDRLAYDLLLLATGARPRTLSCLDRSELVHTLRTREDAMALRRALQGGVRLAVVGAGLIGLEVAAAARRLGCTVTVLETACVPLARVFPADVAAAVANLHRQQGVELLLGVEVEGIEQQGKTATLRCTDGTRVSADLVLVGVGAEPDSALAEAAGLACDNGVLVDEFCRTSAAGILAAGDVARRRIPELGVDDRQETWQNAQDQALAAARTACGGTEAYRPLPQAWTRQYDRLLQLAGDPREADRQVAREGIRFYFAGQRLAAAIAFDSARDFAVARHLVGRSGLDERDLADGRMPLKRLLASAQTRT